MPAAVQVMTSLPEPAAIAGPDEARRLIDEGRRLRGAGDRGGALAAFRQASQADPTSATAIIECGYDHLHLVQVAEARAAFERGLALDADNKSALIGLGHTFRHLTQLDDAERAFRRVLELEPSHGGASIGLAYTLRSLDRRDEALLAFQAAAKAGHAGAQVEAANLLRDLGRPAEAIAVLRELTAREPANAAQLVTLARLLKQTGQLQEALVRLRAVVHSKDTNVNLQVEFGYWLLEAGQLDDSRSVLELALREAPDNTSAMNALAYVFQKAKQLDLAAETFRRLIQLQPENVGCLQALGWIAWEKGEWATALAFFGEVQRRDPNNLPSKLQVGRTLLKLGQIESSLRHFGQILLDHPHFQGAHLELGRALRSIGRPEEALQAFEAASALDATASEAAVEAGNVLLHLQRPVDAERQFQSALARRQDDGHALVGLSRAMGELGRFHEAESTLRQVLRMQPHNTEALIALGHILLDQYRLDEGEALAKSLLELHPTHATGMTSLGNICRRRGDRNAALEAFRRAAATDPLSLDRKLDVAIELRELGSIEQATTILDDILANTPDEPKALLQLGYIFRKGNRRREALDVFTALSAHQPRNAQAMVEIAIEERSLGHPLRARKWLARALDIETDNLSALLQLAEIAMLGDDPNRAAELYQRASSTHPDKVWGPLGSVRALFEAGQRDRAFKIIEDSRARFGHLPEIVSLEIDLLCHLRNWRAALCIIERQPAAYKTFWIWYHEARISIVTGDLVRAASVLATTPWSSTTDQSRIEILRGLLAEAQFNYADAIQAYRRSIALAPGDAWPHFELARAAMLALDVDNARQALVAYANLARPSLLLKGQAINPSQNHVGQLLDEFLLDGEALAALKLVRQDSSESQLNGLRNLIFKYPDYTPAAILTLITLRQAGDFNRIAQVSPTRLSPIPSQIVQFWDRSPPEDILELMASWQRFNPGYSWTCYNDEQAQTFLKDEFGDEVVQAYCRAHVPAQKADLFRLAHLTARGGVYVDADDRCLTPISDFIDPQTTLVVYQENYGSIGNNFIAASPEHPVIVRALQMAVAALNRGDSDLVWLSTGPGLLTRAFALEWANQRLGSLLRRTQVMNLGEMQSVVGIHCPVRYKSTALHWSRSTFGRIKALQRSARTGVSTPP
jgi:tetratricopeptide (TPR) repeat protein